jgi:F-type H+-transporting ATPase subunit gamma
MNLELEHLKRRIRSTRQVHKVTSALQRVSAARLVNDRRALENSTRYTDRMLQILGEVLREVIRPDLPLFVRPGQGWHGLVVFGSDRGLCGGFNRGLAAAAAEFARARAPTETRVYVVGRVANRKARQLGLKVARAVQQPSRAARGELLDRLAVLSTTAFLGEGCLDFHVLHSRFVSGLRQEPVCEQMLPVPVARTAAPEGAVAGFEPAPESILAELAGEFVRQRLDHAFLDGLAAEDAARQMAMSRASENAEHLLGELMMTYRRLRQESITTEMIELIGATQFGAS